MQPSDDSYCVLLVEDQPIIRENVKEELEEESFQVLAAESAEEARRYLAAYGDRIAAAFVDIDLGPGEDGYGLARFARQVKPDLRVVYTSGGARGCMLHERVADSVFVAKPYRAEEIGALLKDMLSLSKH